jgi:heparin binding hemagglutinin HbhA
MAKTTFDIKSTLYAGAGVADLAVETVREYVADVQKRFAAIDLNPEALREQARSVVNERVDALAKDAKSRRSAIEARVAELQGEAKVLPTKVQGFVDDNVATATSAYGDLAKRGEVLVTRIRRQESTAATATAAKTTATKAKTTRTQAAKATKTTAKKTTTTAKKTAAKKSAAPKSSAKATATAAKKTAASAAEATTDAAAKIGD